MSNNNSDQDTASVEGGIPEEEHSPASTESRTPEDDQNDDEFHASVKELDEKLYGSEDDGNSEEDDASAKIAALEAEKKELVDKAEAAEKRYRDTQSAYTTMRQREKERELEESAKGNKEIENSRESESEGDGQDSSESTSEKSKGVYEALPEATREFLEENEEMKPVVEMIDKLNKKLESIGDVDSRISDGISERERQAQEKIEIEHREKVDAQLEEEWIDKASEVHPNVRELREDARFTDWLNSNENTVRNLTLKLEPYDPARITRVVDAYYEDKGIQVNRDAKRSRGRSAMTGVTGHDAPSSLPDNDGDEFAAECKRIEKQKSRRNPNYI